MSPHGRPKTQIPKECVLVLRVSAAEKQELAAAARKSGAGGVSTWVRMLALREARKHGA